MELKFHTPPQAPDHLLKFAVIVSRYQGQWLLVQHRERATFEVPGGHREPGEDIDHTARRELWEETGAKVYNLRKVCAYSVEGADNNITGSPEWITSYYGMLYYAEIEALSPIPDGSEIKSIHLFDTQPENMTYPHIQPLLAQYIETLFPQSTPKGPST